jgi:hypothetical protein
MMPTKPQFIEAMAKHLPPSASDLRLLDIGGVAAETLLKLRPDLQIETASLNLADWDYQAESFDAVVAYDMLLKSDFLTAVLTVTRAGGRLIIVNPLAEVDERPLKALESNGYIRILLEAAVDGVGLLLRGEKAHQTANTLQRVEEIARRDSDLLDLATYRGRFVYLLIQQSPNKPVWALKADEPISWKAVAVENAGQAYLLAYSSLPKAVNFMQSAVLQGFIRDVNKLGKFSKETAAAWPLSVLLNPNLGSVREKPLLLWEIDAKTAESSDE